MGSPPTAPKAKFVTNGAPVTVTIDTITWPHKVLQIRGKAEVSTVNSIAPEYAASARRYFGEEQGKAWVQQVGNSFRP